jgi:hypothetical protein
MSRNIITLNDDAFRAEIGQQISQSSPDQYAMADARNLIAAINEMDDEQVKSELLRKYLDIVAIHQEEKNLAMRNESISRIKLNEQITSSEIAKDAARTTLFSDKRLVVFISVFPICASMIFVGVFKESVFAAFMTTAFYVGFIVLYFSSRKSLAAAWRAIINQTRLP